MSVSHRKQNLKTCFVLLTVGEPINKCIHQGEPQPIDNFANATRKTNGKQSWCRDCKRDWQSKASEKIEYWQRQRENSKKPERILARQLYNQSEKTKELNRIRSEKIRQSPEHAPKILARNRLNKAIRAGKIPHISTQKCIHCGNQANQYHHYLGYDSEHWYDVEPTCYSCHVATYKPEYAAKITKPHPK